MIEVETTALVDYHCTLTDEDERKVREYAEEHCVSIPEAVNSLFWANEINVYDVSDESDFHTQEISTIDWDEEDEEEEEE